MSQTHREAARDVPIVQHTDVLVAGGGPAGVAAALAAARSGASVILLECHGQLGGVWTTGLLSWVLDAGNKGGVMAELIAELDRRADVVGNRKYPGGNAVPYDVEQMKVVLEQACVAAGVHMRLHTRVVAAARDADNRLAVAITESKSGREAWAAKVFIDCTGDGDLAAQAGCGFDFGRPAQGVGSEGPERAGETQPMTLMCLITGIDNTATAEFHERKDRPWHAPKDALQAEFNRAGVEPSYGRPTIFEIAEGLFAWMINHEYGGSGLSAQDITDATLRARAELNTNIDALRSLGGIWKHIRIVATAGQIGVREGRRIHGRYTVTVDDLIVGREHDDAVCKVTFGIDVHSTNKAKGTGIEQQQEKKRTQPYVIPLRALIAKDVDGLLMAGRCISGDFLAHSSYRVTGNAVACGEAAGRLAAIAATTGRLPHDVPHTEVLAPVS